MTKEQFKEKILEHANHDYEECVRIFKETGECLWCENTRQVEGMFGEEFCPICTYKEADTDEHYQNEEANKQSHE